jgi:hypothetical protein
VLDGARTSHDIDVVVRSHYVGFDVLWLVECKQWSVKVSKVHVLALRQIVIDVGADRGILLCEVGFQSGALEAANLTNVALMSLGELKTNCTQQVDAMRLRELFDRIQSCQERYWNISKKERIELGLRPDVGTPGGYRGTNAIDIATELLSKAFRGTYPIKCDSFAAIVEGIPEVFKSVDEIVAVIEPLVSELESKLDNFDKRVKQRSEPSAREMPEKAEP